MRRRRALPGKQLRGPIISRAQAHWTTQSSPRSAARRTRSLIFDMGRCHASHHRASFRRLSARGNVRIAHQGACLHGSLSTSCGPIRSKPKSSWYQVTPQPSTRAAPLGRRGPERTTGGSTPGSTARMEQRSRRHQTVADALSGFRHWETSLELTIIDRPKPSATLHVVVLTTLDEPRTVSMF